MAKREIQCVTKALATVSASMSGSGTASGQRVKRSTWLISMSILCMWVVDQRDQYEHGQNECLKGGRRLEVRLCVGEFLIIGNVSRLVSMHEHRSRC